MKYAAVLLLLLGVASTLQAASRFYPDDPIVLERDPENAAFAEPWTIDLLYDLLENMFTRPGDKALDVRAQDVNTIDEVPDSNWFTNRAGSRPMTPDEIAIGPDLKSGPAEGTWTVISAKNDGVTPGFTIRDMNNDVWFIKFDPPGYSAMATGTEVVITKMMWALGYFVPENHIARLEPSKLVIAPATSYKLPSGRKRQMKPDDVSTLLRLAQKDRDGSYRVIASLALPGKPLGGFHFYGTRPDDPNDTVPHEHRRELRGYRVFAAWFNHVDSKSINTLDTLITGETSSYIRHNLLDFGSDLGSAALAPREAWEGYEYLLEDPKAIRNDLVTFGFRVEPWRTIPMYKSRSVGRLTRDNKSWDPDTWVPRVPNAAFLRARADDKFWAARKAMAISDDMIRAAVKTGQFQDQESEAFLTQALIDRRNAIGQKYLTAINPIVDPSINSSLRFGNAAVDYGFAAPPQRYEAEWFSFNNETGESSSLGSTAAEIPEVLLPDAMPGATGAYVKISIKAISNNFPAWQQPVIVYFHKTDEAWKLVGFERQP